MRIALFTDTFPPQINGVANHVATLASTLVGRGHEVCVVTVSSEQMWGGDTPAGDGYEVVVLPSLPALIAPDLRAAVPSPAVIAAMMKFKPDIIHVHTPMGVGWAGIISARTRRIPVVGTHHTFFDLYLKSVGLAWTQDVSWRYVMSFYNRCAHIIAPSRAMSDAFAAHKPKVPVVQIENGIDLGRFSPVSEPERVSLKARFGFRGDVIMYLGRLSPEKCVDQVIEAFRHRAAEVPDSTLLIVGDGPDRTRLEQRAAQLDVGTVIFAGFQTGAALIEHIRVADVFISASQFENMPLSVLEVMACGVPVVAVRSLGMAEIVRDDDEGCLAETGDAAELAEALRRVLLPERRQLMRERALARSADFDKASMVERIEAVYVSATVAPKVSRTKVER